MAVVCDLVKNIKKKPDDQMTALGKKIDKIAEAGSLVPGDVHNCVRRIVAVQEALDRSVAYIFNHLFRVDIVVFSWC